VRCLAVNLVLFLHELSGFAKVELATPHVDVMHKCELH
jgi:hypothetical protein